MLSALLYLAGSLAWEAVVGLYAWARSVAMYQGVALFTLHGLAVLVPLWFPDGRHLSPAWRTLTRALHDELGPILASQTLLFDAAIELLAELYYPIKCPNELLSYNAEADFWTIPVEVAGAVIGGSAAVAFYAPNRTVAVWSQSGLPTDGGDPPLPDDPAAKVRFINSPTPTARTPPIAR